jgi:hypothetical protein
MSVRSRVGTLVGRTRRARIITAATVLALAVAVIAFIALDSGDNSSEPLHQNEYQQRADRICLDGKATLVGVGRQLFTPPQPPDAFAKYMAISAQTAMETRSKLAALDAPSDLQAEADALDASLVRLTAAARAAERAIRAASPSRIQVAAPRVESATTRTDEAAARLGLIRCAALRVRLRPG